MMVAGGSGGRAKDTLVLGSWPWRRTAVGQTPRLDAFGSRRFIGWGVFRASAEDAPPLGTLARRTESSGHVMRGVVAKIGGTRAGRGGGAWGVGRR